VSSDPQPVALITGITGQDGSYLAEDLVAKGWSVHGLVRASSVVPAGLAGLAQVQLHTGDITAADDVRAVVAASAPHAVFHLAALSSVWRSWEEPVLTANVNALSTAALLEACLQQQDAGGRPVSFVNASSAEMFAGTTTWPQTEQTPFAPTSPYGVSKVFSHQLTQIYRTRGLKASNAILYNHESPRRPDTFVTRKITKAVAGIAVNGTGRLTLGNLDARRDWGWAPDYVRAMTLMAEHPEADDFIIATGVDHSVRDFVQFAFEAARVEDWQAFLTTDPAFTRAADAKVLVGDPAKAAKILDWTPTLDLRQIVGKMVQRDLSNAEPWQR
jgi:GDPmannose 4,6-dehydratase